MSSQPVGCLGFIFRLFPQPSAEPPRGAGLPKVMISNRFVTSAEADFFRVLQRIVGPRGHVLAQVSLKQLLFLPGNYQSNPGRASWQNKVDKRSIDFLICHPATLKPLLAIELDEPSHSRPERQSRDAEVEGLLIAADLPFIRVLAGRTWDTRELDDVISPHLATTITTLTSTTPSPPARASASQAPPVGASASNTPPCGCPLSLRRVPACLRR